MSFLDELIKKVNPDSDASAFGERIGPAIKDAFDRMQDGDGTYNGTAGNNTFHGGKGNDTMRGGEGADKLFGDQGNDWINGGNGNDEIFGGSGRDHLAGGRGHDRIDGGAGNDKLDGGTGNDMLWGGGGDDVIKGGQGRDLLNGGAGKDSLDGGDGNDTYYVDDSGDRMTENVDEGTADKVFSTATTSLGANVEELELTGAADVNGVGNETNQGNNNETENTAYVTPDSDMVIAVGDTPDPTMLGQTFEYLVTMTNNGPDAANNATMNMFNPGTLRFQMIEAPQAFNCTTPPIGNAPTMSCQIPSLAVGASVLAACVVAAQYAEVVVGSAPLGRIVQESLVIMGWVANWRPLEIFLYDWWPIVRRRNLYRRLAAAKVELKPLAPAAT